MKEIERADHYKIKKVQIGYATCAESFCTVVGFAGSQITLSAPTSSELLRYCRANRYDVDEALFQQVYTTLKVDK